MPIATKPKSKRKPVKPMSEAKQAVVKPYMHGFATALTVTNVSALQVPYSDDNDKFEWEKGCADATLMKHLWAGTKPAHPEERARLVDLRISLGEKPSRIV